MIDGIIYHNLILYIEVELTVSLSKALSYSGLENRADPTPPGVIKGGEKGVKITLACT